MNDPRPPRISLLVRVCAIACVLLATACASLATAQPMSAALTEFKAAWQRVSAGQPDQPDSSDLKALPIYPYLVAARLQRDLDHLSGDTGAQQTDAAVQAFLKAHEGEPVTRGLTTAWLRSLAQRKDWPALLAHYEPARADDALQCQWFEARIATGDTAGLAPAVAKFYLAAAHSVLECDAAFDWLKARQRLTPQMTVQRTTLALQAGDTDFARQLAAQLPDAQAAPLQQWVALLRDSESSLRDLIAHPDKPVPDDALQAGWFRLARRHPDVALTLYPQLIQARQLHGAQAKPYTRDLALGLAWDRRPQAVDYFARFTPDADDDTAFTWRVRAALWAQDWTQALQWIDGMPASLRRQPAWQYWRARAQDRTGATQAAHTAFQLLAADDGYYSLLAAWRLQRNYTPRTTTVPDDPTLRDQFAAQPGVIRAHQLFEVGLDPDASLEWLVALSKATPNDRVQGIRLAMSWGWYNQAVATATQQGVFEDYALLYPLPYDDAVKTAARDSGLSQNWIYGVIRQESLYRDDAVSSANAYGLMQLRLPTARIVARRHNMPVPQSADDLFDPTTNLALGSTLLRDLTDQNDGRFIVALAGYNAGHNAADRWLPDHPLPADVWIENIPYNETRGYVQRILWHIGVFGWRRSGEAQSIADLLPLVAQPEAQTASR